MIAQVIPLTRLPARFTFFDYCLTEHSEVHVGDLVEIFFRGRVCYGVVWGIGEKSTQKKLSPILKIIQQELLSKEDLARITTLATCIGESLATILFATLPKHLPRKAPRKFLQDFQSIAPQKISTEELSYLKHILPTIVPGGCTALQGDTETGIALAYILAGKLAPSQQLLILVPHDRDAASVARALKHLPLDLGIVTGTTPEPQRAKHCFAWKQGTLRVLVCTHNATVWSAHTLAYVLVLSAGNDVYTHKKRHPHIDPREAGKLLAQQHHASYISIDSLPRLEDCTRDSLTHTEATLPTPTFVDLRNTLEKTEFPLITHTLQEAIRATSQQGKNVLLFLNRKGAAKRLQCALCDHIPLCGVCGNLPSVRATNDLLCQRCGTEMWIPPLCPACQKPRLKLVGVGGEKVLADLHTCFPDLSIRFIEKGNDQDWKSAHILVATEHIFANLLTPFVRMQFGLVADLMADLPVHGIDFRATESTARKLLRLLFLAKREKAQCIIQTWLPHRLPSLIAPTFVLEEELSLREKYLLPPFGKIYTTPTQTLRNPAIPPLEHFIYDGTYL